MAVKQVIISARALYNYNTSICLWLWDIFGCSSILAVHFWTTPACVIWDIMGLEPTVQYMGQR